MTLEHQFIAVLLMLFLAKGVVLTFAHEPFSGHDEVAHFAYLQYVAEEKRLPVIPELEDWQQTFDQARQAGDISGSISQDKIPASLWKYCRFTTSDWQPGCQGDSPLANAVYAMTLSGTFYPTGWVYTANHPPLFYLLMTPVYWLTDGQSEAAQLYALRLATVPLGMLVVLFAFLTIRILLPRDRFLALLVPTFVAFQPQISYESAMLNNDILAILCTTIVIYLLVRGLRDRFPVGNSALIGFFFGLAMLAKNTSVTSGALIAFAMILGLGIRNWRLWLPRGALAGGITAMMVWPWFLYMYRTYGDFTALGRIRELQYWNYNRSDPPSIWQQLYNRWFVWDRWHETWGAFGWRLIYISHNLATILLYIAIIAAIGIGVWAVRFWYAQRPLLREDDPDAHATLRARLDPIFDLQQWQVTGIATMGVTCILSYYAILQFGTTFSLTQARYYFPAIVPAAILFALGIRSIVPRPGLRIAQAVFFLGLVSLNVVIYTAYVIPYGASAGKVYVDIDRFFR